MRNEPLAAHTEPLWIGRLPTPQSLMTPARYRPPFLRVIRPRHPSGTRETFPETLKSRRTPPPSSLRSPRDLLRHRQRSIQTSVFRWQLTRDPRIDLFSESHLHEHSTITPERGPTRLIRVLVHSREERNFMIAHYFDSLAIGPADRESPGCRRTRRPA